VAARDEAVRDDPEEDYPRLPWRIRLPIAGSAEMLQLPGGPVLQRLFEAVRGTHNGIGREGPRLTRTEEEGRSVDVALAMANHARHESGRLEPCQPLFGHAGVQTTIGLIDGNRNVHDCWAHVE